MEKISQKKFEKIVKGFYEEESARGSFWYKARNLVEKGYDIEAYILILATWNFADFRYFLTNFDLIKFERLIKKLNPIFEELKGKKFKTINFNNADIQKKIKTIYRGLKRIVRQTGATKLMALKNPNLFVMWDTSIRKMYKINNKANPDDYINFLLKIKERFENIKWRDKKRPLAKVIDEYNYLEANKK